MVERFTADRSITERASGFVARLIVAIDHPIDKAGDRRKRGQRCSSNGFRSFIENGEIGLVNEQPVAFAPSNLTDYSESTHVVQRLRDRWRRDADLPGCCRNGYDWIALHMLKNAEDRSGGTTKPFDLALVLLE
jgi:hypothetical protein